MAFQNKRSWRYQFIDIDDSFVMNDDDETINGFIVARGPKGKTRPEYFPAGNEKAIDAICGVGSANWPDLIEAKAFNAEYPIYISEPAGSSKLYPSYLGGFYVTKNGLHKFYNVKDEFELEKSTNNAYKVKVQPGLETLYSRDFEGKTTTVEIGVPGFEYEPNNREFGFGFIKIIDTSKLEESNADFNKYFLRFSKNSKLNVTAIDYDVMKEGLASSKTITSYWSDNDSIFDFTSNTATLYNFGISYKAEELAEANPLKDWIGEKNFEALKEGKDLAKLLVDGFAVVEDKNVSIAFSIQNTFSFLVDIKEDVYAYFMQRGPTEIKTKINVSDIGYDKYRFDALLNYAPYNVDVFNEDGTLVPDGASDENESEILKNEYLGFYNPEDPEKGILYIGRLNTEDEENVFYEVEGKDDFITKYIAFQDAVTGNKVSDIYHKIYYVATDEIKHLLTEEETIAIEGEEDGPEAYVIGISTGKSAPKAANFNQMTISCSETVYTGITTSGGTFTGSFDPEGVDTYGNNIYFPKILSDDDFSFIEVRVLKAFGDDMDDYDSQGFWKHARVIDKFDIDKDGSSPTEKNFSIEGDRYCTLVMQTNLVENKVGGTWRPEYEAIIREGLTEALLPEYDDVQIFMEPTGQETFKKDLATLTERVDALATIISPKILVPNNNNVVTTQIANRVVVQGRVNQASNAQFAGEFEVYDKVTKRKYRRQPIGSIGRMLARIIERRYGGVAPFGTNVNGMGGQLTDVECLKSCYQFEDDAMEALDKKGVNVLVLQNGTVQITSHKTTQDPLLMSDWSYLGHTMSFCSVKRELRDNVMAPQAGKPINSYWMGVRQNKADQILAKRTVGSDPIWSKAICEIDSENVNNAATKAKRNFVINVDVWVTPFSEKVTLVLRNRSQDSLN